MEEPDITAVGAEALGLRTVETRETRKHSAYGPASKIMHIQFALRQWDGPFLERGRENAGKGRAQVYSLDGAEPLRSCQEVEVAKRLRSIRDHAFWMTNWGLTETPWMPWARKLREAPDWLVMLNAKIGQRVSSRNGGAPDVVAWNDQEPVLSALFVECKGQKEGFKETQEAWIWAAQEAGVQTNQLAVAVLPFTT